MMDVLVHAHTSGAAEAVEPRVVRQAAAGWPAVKHWTPEYLQGTPSGSQQVEVRIGKRYGSTAPSESDCEYRMCTLAEFCEWLTSPDNSTLSNYHPLAGFSSKTHFGYLDYNYFPQVFQARADPAYSELDWQLLGYGHSTTETVLWLGSAGSCTPLHYDTYGANVVVQVFGQKQWLLLPPSLSSALKPTRIPFEESSVYALNNPAPEAPEPWLESLPRSASCGAVSVVLDPGDVLIVPHRWWHHVCSLTTSLSVNLWVPHSFDATARLHEALTATCLMSLWHASSTALTSTSRKVLPSGAAASQKLPHCPWLHPTERHWTAPAAVATALRQAQEVVQDRQSGAAGPGVRDGEFTTEHLAQAVTHPDVVSFMARMLLDGHDAQPQRGEGTAGDGTGNQALEQEGEAISCGDDG